MKKISFLFLTGLLLSSLSLEGQSKKSFGLKAGVSLANQSIRYTPIDYTIDTDIVLGPAVGLFYETFRGSNFSLQTDLLYNPKGSKTAVGLVTINHLENDRIEVIQGDLAISKFHYLSLSPMLRYRLEKGSKTIYAMLGPRLDYLLVYNTDSAYPLEDQNESILGLTGALGMEMSFYMASVFAEIQYMPDLSPLTNEEPLLVNNNSLLINFGLRLAMY